MSTPAKSAAPIPASRAELSAIDASTRAPVLFFLLAAVSWLLVGTAFALITSIKLHSPPFLASAEYLTYGRTQAAGQSSLAYGWAMNALFAVVIWLMARLSRAELRQGGLLVVAACFWNIGVTTGVLGILAGDLSSLEWLDLPAYAAPLLLVAYAFIGAWALMTFRDRRTEPIFVSQWYLLGALFWFPWLYSVAEVMVFFAPARGTVQSIVAAWYGYSFVNLELTAAGLGAIYYFLPKILGKPVQLYNFASLGFWLLAVFTTWAGAATLAGGPVPAWVPSVGIVTGLITILPVVIIGLNHHLTIAGSLQQVKASTTLKFVVFGAIAFTVGGIVRPVLAVRDFSEVVHFTHVNSALTHLTVYGFFTMVMFGAIYYLTPRLLEREWPSCSLLGVHFWTVALGTVLYVVGWGIGGYHQGEQLNVPLKDGTTVPFLDVVRNLSPFFFSSTVAWVLITVGHLAFALNFLAILLKARNPAAGTTMFRNPPALEVAR